MLALPVERLVGNSTSKGTTTSTSSSSTNTHLHSSLSRNSVSPDSSTLTSDLSSSASSSPASSPNKRMDTGCSPRRSLSPPLPPPHPKSPLSSDLKSNSSQNPISPARTTPTPEPETMSPPPSSSSRKRRRSRSSSVESNRSISPGTHDLVIKQESTSPRSSPPIQASSCHSCCCQQKSPSPRRDDEMDGVPFSRRMETSKSNCNNDSNNSTSIPGLPTKIEEDLEECANNNRTNKINNNRPSAHHHIYYHSHHHQIDVDHHRNHNQFNSREEVRERPTSRSKLNHSNNHNGIRDAIVENGGGGHPSMSVDNGLSSPGSISSTSSNGGRPPSRPPSTASTASSSCFSSVLSLSTSTVSNPSSLLHNHFTNYQNRLNHHHPSHFLKFSIEDILRPDFGKVHNKTTHHHNGSSSNLNLNSPSQSHHHHPTPTNGTKKTASVQQQSQETRPNSRASSFKYHSDDSNCSSTTSRHTEVVDETKVNPKVPEGPLLWPAWVYCTRYSDRPSSGPRSRRIRKEKKSEGESEEKRPRTAFTAEQLARLKQEFDENRYLTEKRRQDLAQDLKLHENQIKIWFQNKRAKLKKSTGQRNGLAMQLMAQGLYNHSTIPVDEDEEMLL